MTKDNLISPENLIQILTFIYKKGNNSTDTTPEELMEEIHNKLKPLMKDE